MGMESITSSARNAEYVRAPAATIAASSPDSVGLDDRSEAAVMARLEGVAAERGSESAHVVLKGGYSDLNRCVTQLLVEG